jgi:predicted deacylase
VVRLPPRWLLPLLVSPLLAAGAVGQEVAPSGERPGSTLGETQEPPNAAAEPVRAELPIEPAPGEPGTPQSGTPIVTPVTEFPPSGSLPSGEWGPVSLLGVQLAPGDKRRVVLRVSESFVGAGIEIPVLAARGDSKGPVLCVTAGVHGDELNGIELVRLLFEHTTPRGLAGMLVALPVVNLHGFRRSSRYLPDRRDLNRFFPGHPRGSSASRIAWAVFDGVIRGCDALVDLHTGSFHRTNLPQIRADLGKPGFLELAKAFGAAIVIHSEGQVGTLRRAASDAGIRSLTYEAGEPMRIQRDEITRGARGVRNLMAKLGMLSSGRSGRGSPLVFQRTAWVRVDDGGIFVTERELGDRVQAGDALGRVTDPISNERAEILAPVTGRIIGMALPQVVIPGFAIFHIGVDAGSHASSGIPKGMPTEPGAPDQLDSEEMPE